MNVTLEIPKDLEQLADQSPDLQAWFVHMLKEQAKIRAYVERKSQASSEVTTLVEQAKVDAEALRRAGASASEIGRQFIAEWINLFLTKG